MSPTRRDFLVGAFSLLPAHLVGHAYVAGGAAVNDDPRDIDIWIIGQGNPGDTASWLSAALINHGVKDVKWSDLVHPDKDNRFYDPSMYGRYKVCEFKLNGKKVQVMVTGHENVKDLIDEFDISCHAAAVDASFTEYHGTYFTPLTAQPRVQRFDTPHSTLRRYFILCERYNHTANWEDVEQLAKRVVKAAETRA